MSKKKTTVLPFLLIVSFSIIVMLAVVIAQYHSQKGIRQLENGNAQALIAFQVDNLLDEIINQIYIIEEEAKVSVTSGNRSQYDKIKQDLQKLERENEAIEELNILDTSSKKEIQSLSLLIEKKVAPFKELQYTSADTIKKNILAQISSEPSKQLTDSIYVTALKIQIELEKNLQNTFAKNEVLSVTVLSFSRILGFISIAAIAILASIIIRRLMQNYKLIKALEAAKLHAEKLSDIKEQFLANMSHEIRTPVNSVLGFTALLEKTDMKDNQVQFVNLIKTAGENLLNVINDILDISKIESGMFHFDKGPFDLREICYSVEMMFYHRLAEQQLLFECNINEDVPEVITGDKDRLTQILINLINNAIKFTK
ncbi:MAG: histidine kinase dimerization/phospho-acceptor domain-containing protein, partial [Ferruginibacter sp.]